MNNAMNPVVCHPFNQKVNAPDNESKMVKNNMRLAAAGIRKYLTSINAPKPNNTTMPRNSMTKAFA